MKGNTIVRKMKDLYNIIDYCKEAKWECCECVRLNLSYSDYHDDYTKQLRDLTRKMNKAQKKLDMIWKRNVPKSGQKLMEDL